VFETLVPGSLAEWEDGAYQVQLITADRLLLGPRYRSQWRIQRPPGSRYRDDHQSDRRKEAGAGEAIANVRITRVEATFIG